MDDVPPAPESRPETPLAIERLAMAVEKLREDIAAQGTASARQLISVLDALGRFDKTLQILTTEMQAQRRDHLDLVDRVKNLEARAWQAENTGKRKRRAAASHAR